MQTSTDTTALLAALLRARRSMLAVRKMSKNPFFKSNYADWPSVLDVAMPALDAHDLVLTIAPGKFDDGVLLVACRLSHALTGQYMETEMGMPLMRKEASPQGVGAALTYASRQLTQAMLALPSTDDDNEQGSGNKAKPAGADPNLATWKKQVLDCADEEELKAWSVVRFAAISASNSVDEINAIYMERLDALRNS